MAIVKGEKIILKATFTDDDGVKVDPTTPVKITIKQPDGTKDIEDENATRDSEGVFSYEYTTSAAGVHQYKFVSADDAIEQKPFTVENDNTE